MDILILIITGMSVGLVSSFFGIGGGAIMIPVLYTLFPKLPPQVIIVISLGTIFISSTVNSYRFKKANIGPSLKTFLNFAVTCSVGAIIGSKIVYLIEPAMIKKIFAWILVVVVLRTVLSKTNKDVSIDLVERQIPLGITGTLGAILSSLTGLGGGVIYVPMFMAFVKLPLINIAPFSNAAMVIATLIGVIPHALTPLDFDATHLNSLFQNSFMGNINFGFIFILSLGSLITGKYGAILNKKVSFTTKKYLLSALLAVLALKMLLV